MTDRDVRPSPDRVRETLFNWLAPVIGGARCLDLFAGSGALGFEALSRGASHVVFVDREPSVTERIRSHLQTLRGADRARVLQMASEQYLRGARDAFDVVFLDPPFGEGHIADALRQLQRHLRPGHRVYIETETPAPALPEGWETLKSSRAGQVSFGLVAFQPTPHNASQ